MPAASVSERPAETVTTPSVMGSLTPGAATTVPSKTTATCPPTGASSDVTSAKASAPSEVKAICMP